MSGFLLLAPLTAEAGWNAKRFVKMQNKADEEFTSGNYSDALQSYVELKLVLEDAINTNGIDKKQLPAAHEALQTILYQIGRSLQLTGACSEAQASFKSLQAKDDIATEVLVKIDLRLAEASACMSSESLEKGDLDSTRLHLQNARASLDAFDAQPQLAEIAEDPLATMQSERDEVARRLDEAAEKVFDHFAAQTRAHLHEKKCSQVQMDLVLLEKEIPLTRQEEVATLKESAASCGKTAVVTPVEQPPPPEPTGPLARIPLGAWLLAGAGTALLLADGVYEGIQAGTVSDFEDARSGCQAYQPTCQTALDLKSDLQTAQLVSASMFGLGLALLGGGVTWAVFSLGDETPTTEVSLVPTPQGAFVGLKWSLE
ncbi:MAG: hypothetical protein CO108_13415 [Deltaproteobacteria bacterium CG_4_9_14_3_um_filter_63_12]|nr:MAG: hypothetical protein COW42_06050 [Deltaproteobacteria bacterium CG17_big_fil_post_rev_8_21_14_2_50_63_7]PJB41181.1 MAG: hypothetical protein CO108_13415 [Deltaproteobacteria bacterium CG_4_9_14_3_um_filter_63_12]